MQKGTALARPELGHSVHVEVAGLEPAREYWYRFRAGDEVSQIGRTRTAPPAGAAGRSPAVRGLRLQHYEDGYFTAFRRIAEEQFDFVFHTGDYIYEGRADGGRTDRRCGSTTATSSTRSSTTATATRCTRSTAI